MKRSCWFVIAALLASLTAADRGVALHISDFHQDDKYSPAKGDVTYFCHETATGARLGDYGDYNCDSPKSLVKHSLSAAHDFNPSPQFIFWTGDNVPHVPDTMITMTEVVRNIQQTTDELSVRFPNVSKIFPVLGNHDYWPSNGFPDQLNDVYQGAYDHWKKWIGNGTETRTTFLKGGYYKYKLDSKTTLLALNTNLYYNQDASYLNFTDRADPAGQFAFMESELLNAKNNKQFVHILAHIAPGAFERTPNFTWMRPEYNKRFIDITVKYSDVIKWMLFGHHHTDTFHIVKDASGSAVQVMLLAPSVTPWKSTLAGAGANNPAFRFIDFDDSNWDMLDIRTYFVNLTELNNNASAKWKLEYAFSDQSGYNMSPITPQSMMGLLQRMKANDTLFQLYIKYNSVMLDSGTVDGQWKTVQLCAIEFIDLDQYYWCLNNGTVTHLPTTPTTTTPTITIPTTTTPTTTTPMSTTSSTTSSLKSQFSAYVRIFLIAAIVFALRS